MPDKSRLPQPTPEAAQALQGENEPSQVKWPSAMLGESSSNDPPMPLPRSDDDLTA